jgi:transposase InsO family protein
MKVSRNAFYHWFKMSTQSKKKTKVVMLMERIRSIFYESKEVYGSLRIQKQLERENICFSRAYIGVLMRKMGLRSVLKRKFVITTDSNHAFPIAENVLNRNFTSNILGEKWVSDITYIRTVNGFCYLALITDMYSRKIVGYDISDSLELTG